MSALTPGSRLASATARLGILAAMVVVAVAIAGIVYVGTRPVVKPTPPAVPTPTAISSPAADVCPPDIDPDQPGPADQDRPTAIWRAEWAGDTSILALPMAELGPSWTFDVCTNTWLAAATDAPAPGRSDLVWDDGANLLVAIGENGTSTRRPGEEWVDRGDPGRWGAQPGYDPAANLILVRDPATGAMWTYDPDLDTWADVEQVGPMPRRQGSSSFVLATYDAAAARFVLLEGAHTRRVWLFDPRTSTWEMGARLPDTLELFIQADELAYDPIARRSLVYADGRVHAYDARADAWEILYEAGPDERRFIRSGPGVAFDPVNERMVVIGGRIPIRGDWVETDDVVAFDPNTRTWTELLAPSDNSLR